MADGFNKLMQSIGIFYGCDINLAVGPIHYGDVMMGAMASQITSLTIINSTVYSGADQRKHQSPASLARNAENVSVRWRLHDDKRMISI